MPGSSTHILLLPYLLIDIVLFDKGHFSDITVTHSL